LGKGPAQENVKHANLWVGGRGGGWGGGVGGGNSGKGGGAESRWKKGVTNLQQRWDNNAVYNVRLKPAGVKVGWTPPMVCEGGEVGEGLQRDRFQLTLRHLRATFPTSDVIRRPFREHKECKRKRTFSRKRKVVNAPPISGRPQTCNNPPGWMPPLESEEKKETGG